MKSAHWVASLWSPASHTGCVGVKGGEIGRRRGWSHKIIGAWDRGRLLLVFNCGPGLILSQSRKTHQMVILDGRMQGKIDRFWDIRSDCQLPVPACLSASGAARRSCRRCERTMQDALVVKICRYLRAAAMRHTAVVRAFRAHSANNTF